eukprot:TRINITY_DN9855_c0_g1_i1.p1 TRINITY_DN9855_c0_g1~~TRINITY_DN9855_c0_g1_i1.p1  ORF type:complete len:262 (-),score=45.35 TRINITY_DN9855_c0_g1_i1:104-889(-)
MTHSTSQTKFFPSENNSNFAEKTLILPALSLGNVGQLAIDLIINSASLKRVGYLQSPFVVPAVGNDAFSPSGSGCLSLPLEVYSSDNFIFLQQRAPSVKGKNNSFIESLAAWIISEKFGQVIVLHSSDASLAGRRYIPVETLESQLFKEKNKPINNNGSEGNTNDSLFLEPNQQHQPQQHMYISTTSPTYKLFDKIQSGGIAVAVVTIFCSEGDNIPEATKLAQIVNQSYLHIDLGSKGWVAPASWKYLFSGFPSNKNLWM